MKTYTKKENHFVPTAMKCNQKQFEELRPILEVNEIKIENISIFKDYPYLSNDGYGKKSVTNYNYPKYNNDNRTVYEKFDATTFLNNTGIFESKYNLDKLTESHIDELCKDENVKEILTKAGVVPKVVDTGWFSSKCHNEVMIYYKNGIGLYGLNYEGNWENKVDVDILENDLDFMFTTNPLQHLIKEAVKRGFVEGVTIGNTENKNTAVISNNPRFYFLTEENSLLVTVSDGDYTIMQNGIWSTVIKPENEIQVNNPQTVEYVQNGVFVPASVIKDTPNNQNLGEVVRRKFNEKSE